MGKKENKPAKPAKTPPGKAKKEAGAKSAKDFTPGKGKGKDKKGGDEEVEEE